MCIHINGQGFPGPGRKDVAWCIGSHYLGHLCECPGPALEHPRTALRRVNSDQGVPWNDPRPPQGTPGAPQDAPRSAQDRPKIAQDC